MLASPADTARERQKALAILRELNEWYAPQLGLAVQPVMWERQAYPAVDEGGPQRHIDRVLDIDDCDLLIGIFRTRFGAAIGGTASGTEHEIRKAYESWSKRGRPQLMLYFLQKPQIDSKADIDGIRKIEEFRSSLPSILYWQYRPSTFATLLRHHLMMWLNHVATTARTAELAAQRATTTRHPAESVAELYEAVETLRREITPPILVDRVLMELFWDAEKLEKLKSLLDASIVVDEDAIHDAMRRLHDISKEE